MGLFGFDSAGDFKVNNRYLSLAGTRQTVQSGLVDSTGAANFISIGTGLAVNIAATAVPIFLNASGGNVISGRIGRVAADTSITGLTASATNFLFADVAIDGGVTLGAGVLAPIYQFGGTPSVANGQFTFNISEMKAYVGNGTTAPQVYRVYLGEAITNATNVTSVVNYALNVPHDVNSSLGVSQTWVDVTASRALSTTYTNTTGRPMEVLVTLYAPAANANPILNLIISGVTRAIGGCYGSTTYAFLSGIVPSGATYAVTSTGTGGYTLNKWMELK